MLQFTIRDLPGHARSSFSSARCNSRTKYLAFGRRGRWVSFEVSAALRYSGLIDCLKKVF
jgi:hypothetical protein